MGLHEGRVMPQQPFPAPTIVTRARAPGLPLGPINFANFFDGLVVLLVLLPAVWIVELCVPVPDFSVLRRLCHDFRRTLHEYTHAFGGHWRSAVNKAVTSKD